MVTLLFTDDIIYTKNTIDALEIKGESNKVAEYKINIWTSAKFLYISSKLGNTIKKTVFFIKIIKENIFIFYLPEIYLS